MENRNTIRLTKEADSPMDGESTLRPIYGKGGLDSKIAVSPDDNAILEYQRKDILSSKNRTIRNFHGGPLAIPRFKS